MRLMTNDEPEYIRLPTEDSIGKVICLISHSM